MKNDLSSKRKHFVCVCDGLICFDVDKFVAAYKSREY